MIIDISAFTGTWPFYPVLGDLDSVCGSLRKYGIEHIFISPLEAAWCRNPHRFNDKLYEAVEAFDNLWPVPVLDPTIATWQKELFRATQRPKVKLIRLLPAYSPYKLSDIDSMLNALSGTNLGIIVQTRLEDPRRQHPLAQVPDVLATEIASVTERYPDLTIIVGGPRIGEIIAIKEQLLNLPNLFADISQAESMSFIQTISGAGLTEKLLFGSHAPFFIPHAALARVMIDADNEIAEAILWKNAARILFG